MAKGIFKESTNLWVEKYRPKTMDEYVGNKDLKDKIKSYITAQDLQNLLFEGNPGVGKSSVVNLLVKEIDCDFICINASSERGIDTIRTTVTDFCSSIGFSPIKILVLEEFDSLTLDAQNALKSTIEQYAKHTRFLFTCNTIEKVIEPIRSRCQEFKVIPPSSDQVIDRCIEILKAEKIEYDESDVEAVVNFAYPDLRKCIQGLQQNTFGNVLRLSKEYFKLLKYQDEIIDVLKTVTPTNIYDKVIDIRQILADSKVKQYTQLYRFLFDKLDNYCPKSKIIKIIIYIEEGLKYDSFIADKEINITATIIRIAEELSNK